MQNNNSNAQHLKQHVIALNYLVKGFANYISASDHLNILQDNTTAAHILVLHKLVGMLSFLLRLLLKELMEAIQCHIIAVEIPSLHTNNYNINNDYKLTHYQQKCSTSGLQNCQSRWNANTRACTLKCIINHMHCIALNTFIFNKRSFRRNALYKIKCALRLHITNTYLPYYKYVFAKFENLL